MIARTRFYREVSVGTGEAGYSILLDGKPVRTPAGAALALPGAPLAEAVAEEWRGQGDKIRPETMMLTKLANTAIDRVAAHRQNAIDQIVAFAKSDLVCYRAERPASLVSCQVSQWDPLLDWARDRYGAALQCTAGIGFVDQPPEALSALEQGISELGDFALAGVQAAADLTGSALIALGLWEKRLTAEQAFAAAELDESFQAETWGRDAETLIRSEKKAAELMEIARFLHAVRE